MSTLKISLKILNEYSTILNEVDRKIYDLGIVLRQKNLADLTFVIKRLDSFKDIYDESLFPKAVEELKSKKTIDVLINKIISSQTFPHRRPA